jgi:hypothetical protein
MVQQWVNVVLGLWVIAVPFVGFAATGLTWALVITGAVIAILAIWGAQATQSEREAGKMQQRYQHR